MKCQAVIRDQCVKEGHITVYVVLPCGMKTTGPLPGKKQLLLQTINEASVRRSMLSADAGTCAGTAEG